MTKILSGVSVLALVLVAMPVFAANNGTGTQNRESQQGTTTQTQQRLQTSPSIIDNMIQNQNQVQTQNQSENSQLEVNTQEQENLEEGSGTGSQNRNQNTVQNMSEVAAQVQKLQQVRTTGGIGEQVKQIVQEQHQAQAQIQE